MNILIRDVPDAVVAALDAKAQHLGISRTELLRRTLAREGNAPAVVSVNDLQQFAATFGDLADPAVMDDAWR